MIPLSTVSPPNRFLTGNPCTDYRGYRTWVTCALPGLEELDGEKITRSGRIRALREFTEAQTTVEADQREELGEERREREFHYFYL